MSRAAVAFRTTGSATVGLGHLRRCLSLADALRDRGAECHFIVTSGDRAREYLSRRGITAHAVAQENDVDLCDTCAIAEELKVHALVIDSYEVTEDSLSRPRVPVVAVLDDLADRFLPVNLVVNGAPLASRLRYRVAPHTRLLLGSEFLLLRPEFANLAARATRRCVEHVVITVGGADTLGLTPRLAKWTLQGLPDADIDVVVGPFFSSDVSAEMHELANLESRLTVHEDPEILPELMAGSDLAVACGGQTVYELAAAGVPTLAVQNAHNQAGNLKGLATLGALVCVGHARDPKLGAAVQRCLVTLSSDVERRTAMSVAARSVVDGRGADRVANAILSRLCHIRDPRPENMLLGEPLDAAEKRRFKATDS
jgi:UDP-2,4-diacetamido-2,4,6-trideoxy-beta-L-altropyranose hydrolase